MSMQEIPYDRSTCHGVAQRRGRDAALWSKMRRYEIVDTNADNIDGCSLCGNKDADNLGRRRKANWLKQRYAEGLRYKVLRSEKSGDIGMIEYTLGNQAWRPVEAEGYLVIHCLTVAGKHKGQGLGTGLLDSCLRDVKQRATVEGCGPGLSIARFIVGARQGTISVDSKLNRGKHLHPRGPRRPAYSCASYASPPSDMSQMPAPRHVKGPPPKSVWRHEWRSVTAVLAGVNRVLESETGTCSMARRLSDRHSMVSRTVSPE
jgi:GNAT superfamily N-acetyltransferase